VKLTMPSGADAKNVWSCTSLPVCILTQWTMMPLCGMGFNYVQQQIEPVTFTFKKKSL
jgi:hypothetical protein